MRAPSIRVGGMVLWVHGSKVDGTLMTAEMTLCHLNKLLVNRNIINQPICECCVLFCSHNDFPEGISDISTINRYLCIICHSVIVTVHKSWRTEKKTGPALKIQMMSKVKLCWDFVFVLIYCGYGKRFFVIWHPMWYEWVSKSSHSPYLIGGEHEHGMHRYIGAISI